MSGTLSSSHYSPQGAILLLLRRGFFLAGLSVEEQDLSIIAGVRPTEKIPFLTFPESKKKLLSIPRQKILYVC